VSLKGRDCVVVGGGAVGCRRARVLRDFGAVVSLIAPRISERIEGVTYYEREYRPEDAFKAYLAVAATDSREVNHAVAKGFGRYKVPVSVADCPEECTFYFPAVYAGRAVAGVISRDGDHRLAAEAARRVRAALEDL
jgi:glutamyl-tRNA reductase